MASRKGATIEELNREYRAKLARAAQTQYRSADLIDEFLAYHLPTLEPKSHHQVRRYARRYNDWLQSRKLHVLTVSRAEALQFIAWLEAGSYEGSRCKPGAGHVLNHLFIMTLLHRWLRDTRALALADPFKDLVSLYQKRHKAELRPDLRALDENEVAEALEGAEALEEFTLILLLFKTGIRRDEARLLKWTDSKWEERTFYVKPHGHRTYGTVLFDEEAEHFLRLLQAKNARDHPGNPYVFPSPRVKGRPLSTRAVLLMVQRVIRNSPLGLRIADWSDRTQKVVAHTFRRAFTSVVRRNGCPDHITAVLRGDSLQSRSELVPEPTQGIYTKLGKKGGVPELRYWYDRCMPQVGAREIWERVTPGPSAAATVAGLIRAASASGRGRA